MTTLTLIHANLCAGRYDYLHTWATRRRKAFLAYLAGRPLPALINLVEAEAPACEGLAKALGMASTSYRGSAILYDHHQLECTQRLLAVPFLAAPQTQSVLVSEFRHKPTGQRLNVGAAHLPPFATRATLRKANVGLISAAAARWQDPTILTLDANWRGTLEAFAKDRGWRSARTEATTKVHADYRTSGAYKAGQAIDYALLRNSAHAALYAVRNGKAWSDHHALDLAVTL